MGARSVGRERALQALFQLEDGAQSPEEALARAFDSATDDGVAAPLDPASRTFAQALVEGTCTHRASLDEAIERYSHNWRIDRMSRIDRNILRLGAYELCHCPDVPPNVALNEAIELAKRFGTEESSAFVNGVLDRLKASLAAP